MFVSLSSLIPNKQNWPWNGQSVNPYFKHRLKPALYSHCLEFAFLSLYTSQTGSKERMQIVFGSFRLYAGEKQDIWRCHFCWKTMEMFSQLSGLTTPAVEALRGTVNTSCNEAVNISLPNTSPGILLVGGSDTKKNLKSKMADAKLKICASNNYSKRTAWVEANLTEQGL